MNYGDILPEYCNLPDSKIVILPVPYDGTSTWQKGADKGPEAIIAASANMELYDIETDSEVYKQGIYTDRPIKASVSPERLADSVHKSVRMHLSEGRFVVVLGGEHSVSIGAIKACSGHFKGMCVLQLDAHSDMRDSYNGSKYNHACVMARARELCPVVQVGIRSMDITEKKGIIMENVFFADSIQKSSSWVKDVLSRLSSNVYVTIDLDVFDPSVMPSTGTPEPGGLSWYGCLGLLREVARNKTIIGFDVVELCPHAENKAPDFLASKLVYKLLSYKFGGNKK